MIKKKSLIKKKVKKSVGKKQEEYHNKIIKGFFILFGVIFLTILTYYGLSYMISNFTQDGVDYKIVKERNLIFYNVVVPVVFGGIDQDYNFYLRNDPRKLSVEFEGDLRFREKMVINATGDFNCEGNGIIAIANMVNLYQILGAEIMKDETATCDENGRYLLLQIIEGNETKIEQVGPTCYNLEVNNCEILEVTERFMIETFIELQKIL